MRSRIAEHVESFGTSAILDLVDVTDVTVDGLGSIVIAARTLVRAEDAEGPVTFIRVRRDSPAHQVLRLIGLADRVVLAGDTRADPAVASAGPVHGRDR